MKRNTKLTSINNFSTVNVWSYPCEAQVKLFRCYDGRMEYNYKPHSDLATRGKIAYMQFQKVFVLNTVMRQLGADQWRFKELLQHRKSQFKNSIRLISKNDGMSQYNYEQLRRLGKPVTIIKAFNNCSTAANTSTDKAHGLENSLHLSSGTQVILRHNLWTTKGLCNGSLGIVQDIIYKPAESHLDETPICILVKFPNYTGLILYDGCVPVIPILSIRFNQVYKKAISFASCLRY